VLVVFLFFWKKFSHGYSPPRHPIAAIKGLLAEKDLCWNLGSFQATEILPANTRGYGFLRSSRLHDSCILVGLIVHGHSAGVGIVGLENESLLFLDHGYCVRIRSPGAPDPQTMFQVNYASSVAFAHSLL
jgi:hypothetical protein